MIFQSAQIAILKRAHAVALSLTTTAITTTTTTTIHTTDVIHANARLHPAISLTILKLRIQIFATEKDRNKW